MQHFLQFLHVHRLAKLLGHSFYVRRVYCACLVVVEEIEDFVDPVSRLLVPKLRCYGIQKLLEVDLASLALELSYHVENCRVLAFEAETLHGCL